jgi:predicted nucleic acid-binding protein
VLIATAKVVDASAIAALIFDEPTADAVADLVADTLLIAPALIEYELVNVCMSKFRRKEAPLATLLAGFSLFDRLGVELLDIDLTGVIALAAATGLSGYDASYLWLARRHEVELVTLDKRLAAAAAA